MRAGELLAAFADAMRGRSSTAGTGSMSLDGPVGIHVSITRQEPPSPPEKP